MVRHISDNSKRLPISFSLYRSICQITGIVFQLNRGVIRVGCEAPRNLMTPDAFTKIVTSIQLRNKEYADFRHALLTKGNTLNV